MALQIHQTLCRRRLHKRRVLLRVARHERHVHQAAILLLRRRLEQLAVIKEVIQQLCLLLIHLINRLHAADGQQPVERQPGEIDAPSVRRVVHAALVGFDLPVHQLRADGLRVAEQILADNHNAQSGRADVLLRPGVNHPVAVHIHRFGENHGACVGNKGRFDIRQFHKPRAVDGVVLGDVNVIRVGVELRRRHVGNVGVVVRAAGRGDIDFAVALCFFCGKVREIA